MLTYCPSASITELLSRLGMSYPIELSITGYEKCTPLTEKESAPLRPYWKFSTSPSTVVELRWAYCSSVYRSIMLCKLTSAKAAIRTIQTIFPTPHSGFDRDFIKKYVQYKMTIRLTIRKAITPVENTCASQTVFIINLLFTSPDPYTSNTTRYN